ncbi:MAG: HAMP domain-containing sensor histidine kinase [Leptolyngbyaceae cyanobacterium bins.59]|nr:HAMP domain-containing sensor histidine kinase [Leptolyngbyaceae cyanobacterium bins.59]
MVNELSNFFFSQSYIPHGHCYLWQPNLVGLHAISDALIALAYFSIPLLLLYFVKQRQDLPLQQLFWLFGAFIISCGLTHLLEIWTLWHPTYWLSGMMKAITAIVSLFTALTMVVLLPSALRLPGPLDWEARNRELEKQIHERQQVQEALSSSEKALRSYTAQLQQALEFDETLKRITDKVRDSLDEGQILQTAVRELGEVLGVRGCNAAVYDLETQTSQICYEYTTSLFSDQGRVMQMAAYPELYHQLIQGQTLQFCSIKYHPVRGRVVMLASPLFDGEGVLGDLWLINDKDYCFRETEVRLVQQVANQCAIAIRQARLYQTAQAQVEELERMNRLKDDFLSTVSHELRTPMANIKMAIRMLNLSMQQTQEKPHPLPDHNNKVARYLKILQDECDREITLINDLLDLQRLEAQQQPIFLEVIDLQSWISRVIEPFQERMTVAQQTLQVELDPATPIFVSDISCLERILAELLNNACKYTPATETIQVAIRHIQGQLELKVQNSGVEIPPNELPRIFEKFYRVPTPDPWKKSGTGLGLTLVQKLVQALGGQITVSSQSQITCFTVLLPDRPDLALEVSATLLPTRAEVEHS